MRANILPTVSQSVFNGTFLLCPFSLYPKFQQHISKTVPKYLTLPAPTEKKICSRKICVLAKIPT